MVKVRFGSIIGFIVSIIFLVNIVLGYLFGEAGGLMLLNIPIALAVAFGIASLFMPMGSTCAIMKMIFSGVTLIVWIIYFIKIMVLYEGHWALIPFFIRLMIILAIVLSTVFIVFSILHVIGIINVEERDAKAALSAAE